MRQCFLHMTKLPRLRCSWRVHEVFSVIAIQIEFNLRTLQSEDNTSLWQTLSKLRTAEEIAGIQIIVPNYLKHSSPWCYIHNIIRSHTRHYKKTKDFNKITRRPLLCEVLFHLWLSSRTTHHPANFLCWIIYIQNADAVINSLEKRLLLNPTAKNESQQNQTSLVIRDLVVVIEFFFSPDFLHDVSSHLQISHKFPVFTFSSLKIFVQDFSTFKL